MNINMKYFKPKSLTWWMALIPTISGALQLSGFDIPYVSEHVRPLINAYYDVSPAVLLNTGLFGIGLRGALK